MVKDTKLIWRMLTVSIILLIVPLVAADQYQPTRHPNGWYWPTISGSTNTEPGTGYNGWLEPYDVLMNDERIPAIHVGKDFEGNQGEPVFAVTNGEVIKRDAYLTGYGPNGEAGGALIAQFKTSDGSVFRALYGHIDKPHELGPISAGDILGYINGYNPSHLHFGIHLGDKAPFDGKDYRGFIRKDEYTGDTYGWVNPITFLDTNEPGPYNMVSGPSSANIPPSKSLQTNTIEKKAETNVKNELDKIKAAMDSYTSLSKLFTVSPGQSSTSVLSFNYQTAGAKYCTSIAEASNYMASCGVEESGIQEAGYVISSLGLERTGFCIVLVNYTYSAFGTVESMKIPIVCNENGDPYWQSWQLYGKLNQILSNPSGGQ